VTEFQLSKETIFSDVVIDSRMRWTMPWIWWLIQKTVYYLI